MLVKVIKLLISYEKGLDIHDSQSFNTVLTVLTIYVKVNVENIYMNFTY